MFPLPTSSQRYTAVPGQARGRVVDFDLRARKCRPRVQSPEPASNSSPGGVLPPFTCFFSRVFLSSGVLDKTLYEVPRLLWGVVLFVHQTVEPFADRGLRPSPILYGPAKVDKGGREGVTQFLLFKISLYASHRLVCVSVL